MGTPLVKAEQDRAIRVEDLSEVVMGGRPLRLAKSDIESFVAREVVERCIEQHVVERAPLSDIHYSAFVDPSGGSADSFTLAIAHSEGNMGVLDAIRERRPPFSPQSVVSEFVTLLKSYRIVSVQGDRYAGEWPRERFREHGINYEPSAKPKSDIYRDALPLLNSNSVALLDNDRLVKQLCGLERRTSRGGRDSIDHAPGGHDDICNAACGVLVNLNSDGAAAYTYGLMHNVVSESDRRNHRINPWYQFRH